VSAPAARASEIAGSLAAAASDRFATTVTVDGDPSTAGEGMDNEVVFVRLAGDGLPPEWRAPLVVRVQPDVDRIEIARAEVAVQRWCTTVGYPAPRVLALFEPGELAGPSAQLMARVPGVPMVEAMLPTIWRAPKLVALLADLHVRLHRAPVEEWPLAHVSLVRRRLLPVRSWADQLDDRDLQRALTRVDVLVPYLEDHPGVPCHGDFHPLNVMVDGRTGCVLDWTDAGLGDRHGDVARTQLLFRVASVAASSATERAVLKVAGPPLAAAYLRRYARQLPLDRDRVRAWEAVHLVHGWAQVKALHAGVIGRDRERERVPPALAPWLHRRLVRRLDAAEAATRSRR
jgi:aminoglycoside phosphotransferase (APT) family kinase protein